MEETAQLAFFQTTAKKITGSLPFAVTGVDGLFRLPPHTEPTYQLGPLKPFIAHRVVPVVREVVIGIIDRTIEHADAVDVGSLAKNLSNDVRVAVRGLGLPR